MLALAFKAGPSWRQRQRSALWWMSCSHASVLDHRIRPDASGLACGCNGYDRCGLRDTSGRAHSLKDPREDIPPRGCCYPTRRWRLPSADSAALKIYQNRQRLAQGLSQAGSHIVNKPVHRDLRDAVPEYCVYGFAQRTEWRLIKTLEIQLRFSRR